MQTTRRVARHPGARGVAAAVWLALAAGGARAAAEERTATEAAPAVPAATAVTDRVPEAVSLGPTELQEEIVVKGRRGPRVESLEAREIRERGARDLGEALTLLPSVDKVRKGPVGNDVVLRGMKKDDVALTIDGAKVHGACPSRMDPPAFHLDYAEVDAVQVKHGPFDVSQSGGLAGAVDVRTRRGGPGLGTELNLEGGSAAMFSGSLTGSLGTPDYDALVGGAYKRGDPYVMGDGRNFTEAVPATLAGGAPNPARYRDTSGEREAYRIGSGFARVGLAPAPGQRVELGYTRQSAPLALYPYLKMDGIADDTDRVTGRWNAERLGPVAATVSGYYTRVAHDMTDEARCSGAQSPTACAGALPRGWSMGTFARSSVWGGQAELRGGDDGSGVAWKAGTDLYVRTWDNRTDRVMNRTTGMYSSEQQIPDVRIQGAGVYGEGRRALGAGGATRLVAGVRLDVARSEARVDRTALYRKYYPSADLALRRDDVLLGGNVQLERDVGRGVSAWLGYGHGTRLPDPQERYLALTGMGTNPDWLGRPDLAPVRNDEVDLGATWRARGAVVRTQVFHSWYTDYVDLAQVAAAAGSTGPLVGRSYENVRARTYGGEVSGRVALPAKLFAGASVSFTRGLNDTSGTSLAEIPPLKAAASVRWDDGRFFAEAEEIYAARQGFVDASLGEQPTSAWWTTSLKAGAGFSGVKVYATVLNLFDRAYVEHLSYQRDPFASGVKIPEPGRTFQLAAQYAR